MNFYNQISKISISELLRYAKSIFEFKSSNASLEKWRRHKRNERIITVENESFKVLDSWFWNVFDDGWEPETLNVYKKHLNEGVYIDVGAYVGPAVFYASVAGASHIYAIEANPYSFYLLQENLNRNREKLAPFGLYELCVTNEDDRPVEFRSKIQDSTASTMMADDGGYIMWETMSIRLLTFLNKIIFRGHGLIKIDIEGAESLILDDIMKISEYPYTSLLLSLHAPFWKSRKDTSENVLKLFEKFRIFNVRGRLLSRETLMEMLLTDEEKPLWGTEWGNFFEILLKSKQER